MTKPLLVEIKYLLTNALNSDKSSLRKRCLEDVMNLMEEMEMDSEKAEMAIKAEMDGKKELADSFIQKILKEVNKLEYK